MHDSTLTIPWTAERLLEQKARRARRRWVNAQAKAATRRGASPGPLGAGR